MNPKFLGDSYDIVKRFFCEALADLGYSVAINPMFTGNWGGNEGAFHRFVRAMPVDSLPLDSGPRALLLDPDTGVNETGGERHVSLDRMAGELKSYRIVFAFDQSFSRQAKPEEAMGRKLAALRERRCHAFYYNSHARFLFVATEPVPLNELRSHLVSLGLPASRLIPEDTPLAKLEE